MHGKGSTMRIGICDDSQLDREMIRDLLDLYFADKSIAYQVDLYSSGVDVIHEFQEGTAYDIVFLDIQLSDGNSFLFIEQVCPTSLIIFTTAYDEYAVRAFTVNSIDYLLKPIRQERLEEAIQKFEHVTSKYNQKLLEQNDLLEVLHSLTYPGKKYRTRFLISGNEKLITLQVEDIAYFYSLNKITFAVTRQNKEYIIDFPLDKLMEQLDPDKFFRTNRQTIINIESIVKIEPYFQNKVIVHIKPEHKEKILVSKEKWASFKLWLNY